VYPIISCAVKFSDILITHFKPNHHELDLYSACDRSATKKAAIYVFFRNYLSYYGDGNRSNALRIGVCTNASKVSDSIQLLQCDKVRILELFAKRIRRMRESSFLSQVYNIS
jgi:hypothetical protein